MSVWGPSPGSQQPLGGARCGIFCAGRTSQAQRPGFCFPRPSRAPRAHLIGQCILDEGVWGGARLAIPSSHHPQAHYLPMGAKQLQELPLAAIRRKPPAIQITMVETARSSHTCMMWGGEAEQRAAERWPTGLPAMTKPARGIICARLAAGPPRYMQPASQPSAWVEPWPAGPGPGSARRDHRTLRSMPPLQRCLTSGGLTVHRDEAHKLPRNR